jgi:hypothetical protein
MALPPMLGGVYGISNVTGEGASGPGAGLALGFEPT